MRAHHDPDLVLVQEMLAPPPLEDARRSLEYWERRQKSLRLYQRQARREAREMAVRWEARVRAAERVRFEGTVLGRIAGKLGLSGLVAYRLPLDKRRLLFLAWALVPRRFKLLAWGVVAAWIVVAVATFAVVAAVFAQLG
jgi:hypothetical protein